MKRTITCLLGLALLITVSATNAAPVIYKDPMVSLIFSAATPGVGQLYCTKYKRGTFILLGEAVLVACAAYPLARDAYVEYEVVDTDGNPVTVAGRKARAWKDLPRNDRRQVVGCGLAALGVYIWNLFDAYAQAGKYNQRLTGKAGPVAELHAGSVRAGWRLTF